MGAPTERAVRGGKVLYGFHVAARGEDHYPFVVPFDSKKLFSLVEERTGHPVVVIPMKGDRGHVALRSAGRDTPSHIIEVNPQYERFANYLIANQCALILIKFGDRYRVFDFAAIDEKTDRFAKAVVDHLGKNAVKEDEAPKVAQFLVQRLMLLLASAPIEVLAMRWCHSEFPELRAEQTHYVTAYLRELSSGLAPSVRQRLPSDIYDPVSTMNAAYTLAWADLSGERGGLLPYESLGYVAAGQALLDAVDGFSVETADVYRRSVDAWALRLDLDDWYRWNPRAT
jgi:hypothetical protein